MKKISLLTVTLFAIFAFVAISSSVAIAQTSQNVACPVGYTCTPISLPPLPVTCPVGYVCEPISSNNTVPYSTPIPVSGTQVSTTPCLSLANNLKIGDISNDVSLLHDFLIAKGYSFSGINSGASPKNYFGIETLDAVMKYQKSVGVTDTGFVGPMTRGVINRSCNNNSSSPVTSNTPVISRINPAEYSKYGQEISLYGNGLDGTTNIQFFYPNGAVAGSLFPNFVSSDKVTFSLSGLFIENSGYGTYLVNVVTNKCKGGCDSNRVTLRYSRDSSTPSPTPLPSPTNIPSTPAVSINLPKQGDTWSIGETKTISWNYQNFDSADYGNKYVDIMLVPSDGRGPVKLGTNISAPYNSIPVKIYEKTTDGRSAWLPGTYKVRVVCQTTNASRFNSCYSESGYFNVISPSPTPTPTTGSTVR